MFVEIDEAQGAVVARIEKDFPGFTEPERTTPHSDPWVVALTVVRAREDEKNVYHAVAEESKRPGKVRIPHVCASFDVDSIRLLDLFRPEGVKLRT